MTVPILPAIVLSIFALLASLSSSVGFTLTILIILIALNLIFTKLLKAPTPAGRKIMEEIEGFKLFLATGELNRLDPFKKTDLLSKLFEKYLPYVIALNVESEWGEKLNAILQSAGIASHRYQPTWYSGAVWTDVTAASFAIFLNNSLSSAFLSSVSSSPANRSASAGGGRGSWNKQD